MTGQGNQKADGKGISGNWMVHDFQRNKGNTKLNKTGQETENCRNGLCESLKI